MTPVPFVRTMNDLGPLLLRTEARRARATATLDAATRAELGQFLTPLEVAAFLASLFDVPHGPVRLLDPGAGVGSLTAAVVERLHQTGSGPVAATAIEVDRALLPSLTRTLGDCATTTGATYEIVNDDFISWGVDRCAGFAALTIEPFDLVVMNPPYRKINTGSAERRWLSDIGVEVTNLYAAFLAIAVRLLKPGGQLVAITPRSFANGPYFRAFRADFLSQVALRRVHLYDTRDVAFADSGVLQENVVFHTVKGSTPDRVLVTMSAGSDDELVAVREVPYEQVVRPNDPDRFVHLAVDKVDAVVAERIRGLGANLVTLDCAVSTGRVVDFRTRPNLRPRPNESTAPLIYPSHFADGRVQWPRLGGRKPNALAVNQETQGLLLPNGHYVLVKRFTSKEERRRVVAVVSDPEHVPGSAVAFENHLNVFHERNAGLLPQLARGLACFLNSTLVDLFFRQFNGHTQVNATDLRKLPYPSKEQLLALGLAAGDAVLSQEKLDALVVEHVSELGGGIDPLVLHKRVAEAREVLGALGLPKAQTNERSGLTLLALLSLPPHRGWSEAERPLIGITPMMEFMAEHYGKVYAPNSRETVRRQTVHQFVAAGICIPNPDDPSRPTNSGQTVYQVPEEVCDLIRTFGTPEWEERLVQYREVAQALVQRWAAEREMTRVPVTLPGGTAITLSPGGQNVLIKAVIEEFCTRFAPGGHILYVGDAERKFAICERATMTSLGIDVSEHGKMPDVIVYRPDKAWLLVVEAASSHGPMDSKRRDELATVFADAVVPVIYVTAFPDRVSLRKYVADIAWETEVWIADSGTHLIHFDGERFLGPYET